MKNIAKVVTFGALMALGGQAAAVNYDLCAGATSKTMPDGTVVAMWGYGLDTGGKCAATVPGPELVVNDGNLSITLRNELAEPVSILIAGQALPTGSAPVTFTDGTGRTRVRSFTQETAPGASRTYSWGTLGNGTHLYWSGTHPAVQVQMGLYGGVVHDSAAGVAYGGMPYDVAVTLLYSEIDPGLHAAVANGTYGSGSYKSTVNYSPRYFMVNGDPYGQTSLPAGVAGQAVLLRMLNAGLENHAVLLQGQHLSVVAEDGRPYPQPREQYSLLMAAGKTRDAIFVPAADGIYPVYDRRLRVGMLSRLAVGADLLAVNDPESGALALDEDATITVAVLANDVATASIDPATIQVERPPSHGTATVDAATGEITYTPMSDYHGADDFTYSFGVGTTRSNAATVSLTIRSVNDAPVAMDDGINVEKGSRGNVIAVLDNDTDADGDTLAASVGNGTSLGTTTTNGAKVLVVGGNLTYTPASAFSGIDTFGYEVTDGLLSDTGTVTVTVGNVVAPPPDGFITHERAIVAPLPGSTLAGSSVEFSWAANDSEVDKWWLQAGPTPRSKSYFSSGNLLRATSTTVTGLPTDGSTVYITLWHRKNGERWKPLIEQYKAASPQ